VANPYPTGSSTRQETPGFARRDNDEPIDFDELLLVAGMIRRTDATAQPGTRNPRWQDEDPAGAVRLLG
jgi:hypothetical protein